MSRKLFEKLAAEYYILYLNGELVITNKFLRDFKTPPTPEQRAEIIQQAREEVKAVSVEVQKAETPFTPMEALPALIPKGLQLPIIPLKKQPLITFITEAEIPERIKTSTGFYRPNQYSKEAEKALMQILAQGYQYDILVISTKLYYKSGGMPKSVANYLIEGTWLGDYEIMKASLENNTAEKHITKELNKDDQDGHTRYER